MLVIRTRADLLAVIVQHAPTTAASRDIAASDFTTVLGSFLSPANFWGWIVQWQRPGKDAWTVGVWCDEKNMRYIITPNCQVDWSKWGGNSNGQPGCPNGDRPKEFAFKRMMARRSNAPASQTSAA